MSEGGLTQAGQNWNKAVDELFALDQQVKSGGITDRQALLRLSHTVSYLVTAVGALLVDANERGRS